MMDFLKLGIEGFNSSEELLGAYLEDNLPVIDNLKIKQFICENPKLNDLINDIISTNINWEEAIDDSLLESFELPVINEIGNIEKSKVETLNRTIEYKHKL